MPSSRWWASIGPTPESRLERHFHFSPARRKRAASGLVLAPPVTPPCAQPPERAPHPSAAPPREQRGLLGRAFALQDQTSLAVSRAPAHATSFPEF